VYLLARHSKNKINLLSEFLQLLTSPSLTSLTQSG
jgi:hypothetical protein